MSKVNETLQNLRVTYQLTSLDIDQTEINPISQFNKWLNEAISSQCDEPNAFTLSTVYQGQPRGRVVLLKGIHEGRLVFYTNYQSAKGREISLSDKVAMTFLWLPLHRQVRIEGVIAKASSPMSDDYFKKRPRGSQLGAVASPQSQRVSSRQELEALFKTTEEKFGTDAIVPRPAHWGGYEVTPTYFEFWQGRDNRMHDRISYNLKDENWERFRLAP